MKIEFEYDEDTNVDEAFESEKRNICLLVLMEEKGRVADAARRLGLQRTTFYEKLKKWGINPDDYRSRRLCWTKTMPCLPSSP